MADTGLSTAQRQLAHGSKYPYDGGSEAAPAIDWAHAAARGVMADLLDRRGVKWELERVDPDVRADIVTAVAAIVRAAAPSPDTAPEINERAAFEHHERASELRRAGVEHDGTGGWYENPCVESAWEGWQARAALASRPADVDDEGLPPLPEPFENWDPRYQGLVLPVFTAEQFRQGQRDAVAADRARSGGQP